MSWNLLKINKMQVSQYPGNPLHKGPQLRQHRAESRRCTTRLQPSPPGSAALSSPPTFSKRLKRAVLSTEGTGSKVKIASSVLRWIPRAAQALIR